MGIHEECGVFGVMNKKRSLWQSWFITDSMHCSTEDRKAAGSLSMTTEYFLPIKTLGL